MNTIKKILWGSSIIYGMLISEIILADDSERRKTNVPPKPIPGTLKWKFTPIEEIFSNIVPAIGKDGTIYIAGLPKDIFSSKRAHLYALNSNGTLKWEFLLDGNSPMREIIVDQNGTIYLPSGHNRATTKDICIYAINPDGTLKGKHPIKDEPFSCNALGKDGTIYFGTHNNHFYAINPDGTQRWDRETKPHALQGNESSPAISQDTTIYFGSNNGYLYAVTPNNDLKWQTDLGSAVRYSSPAIGKDGTIYIVGSGQYMPNFFKKGQIFAINPENGSIKWQYTIEEEATIINSPTIGRDGTIYIGTLWDGEYSLTNGYLHAINPDGTVKWKYKIQGYISGGAPAIGEDGVVYILDNIAKPSPDGFLCAIDSATGKELWKYNVGYGSSSLLLDKNGTIYVDTHEAFLAINCSSKMLDPQSPWPKFHKNLTNTGCYGNGFKHYISDEPVTAHKFAIEVNSNEYHRLAWEARRIRVIGNYKAEVSFSVKNIPGKEFRIDYDTALLWVRKYSPTHIGIPLRIKEKITCKKWYHYDVNLIKDVRKYFRADPDVINNITFKEDFPGDVEIKELMFYY